MRQFHRLWDRFLPALPNDGLRATTEALYYFRNKGEISGGREKQKLLRAQGFQNLKKKTTLVSTGIVFANLKLRPQTSIFISPQTDSNIETHV